MHGPVRLGEDVELLVADPSFSGTPIGTQLEAAGIRYGFDLAGFLTEARQYGAGS